MIDRRNIIDLARDEAGNMLAIGALGLIVMAALVGGGVDMSRAYKAQSRLQAACDAGVLAGRKAVSTQGFDDVAEAEAAAYFDNNFDQDEQGASGTVFTPTSPDEGNTVEATASTSVGSTIMKIFGFGSIGVDVECSASMGVGNSDVMMVLDVTGSMGDPIGWSGPDKIDMLQDAMKSFYDTVDAAIAGGNTRVRYGFVPYSQTVNVGALLYSLNPNYLADTHSIQSRWPDFDTVTSEEATGYEDPVVTTGSGESSGELDDEGYVTNDKYSSESSCLASLPSNTGWVNVGGEDTSTETRINSAGQQVTTTTETQTQASTSYTCVEERKGSRRNPRYEYRPWYRRYEREVYDYTIETSDPIVETVTTYEFRGWIYKKYDNFDYATYKTFATVTLPLGDEGEDENFVWNGCIEERQSTPASSFSFVAGTGITPVGATDLDIDTPPDTGDDATKWKPLWSGAAYYRYGVTGTTWWGGKTYGPINDPTSDNGRSANANCPHAAQLFAEMTEDEFDAYADSLGPLGNTYHDIGMLWGARLSSPEGIFGSNVNEVPANGGNVARHLIFMTDGAMVTNNTLHTAYGVEFHDRRVTSNGSSEQNSRHTSRFRAICQAVKAKGIRLWVIAFDTGLTADLTACASDNSSFTANDADQLNQAFQEIANEVGELRIIQ